MQVYISHSDADETLARKVASELKRQGIKTWLDYTELFPGENWGSKIAEGLQTSDAMVVLITPKSLNSDRIRRDVTYAIGETSYRKRLIMVLKDVKPQDAGFSNLVLGHPIVMDEAVDVKPIAAALKMAA